MANEKPRTEPVEQQLGRGALTGSRAMEVVASAVEGGMIGIGAGVGLKLGDKLLGNAKPKDASTGKGNSKKH